MASCRLHKLTAPFSATSARAKPLTPDKESVPEQGNGLVMPKNKRYQVTLDDLKTRASISIEQASYLLGISRQGAYNAVGRGDIESIRVGKRFVVLARPLFLKLIGSASDSEAMFDTAEDSEVSSAVSDS